VTALFYGVGQALTPARGYCDVDDENLEAIETLVAMDNLFTCESRLENPKSRREYSELHFAIEQGYGDAPDCVEKFVGGKTLLHTFVKYAEYMPRVAPLLWDLLENIDKQNGALIDDYVKTDSEATAPSLHENTALQLICSGSSHPPSAYEVMRTQKIEGLRSLERAPR
jgi:hypothetical protein